MTLIVIMIDGKWDCSFDGDLQQWMAKRFFTSIRPKLQKAMIDLTRPPNTIRTKRLKIFANVHSELHMTLALFCYDMEDPTRKRIEEDMFRYEKEQHQKGAKH